MDLYNSSKLNLAIVHCTRNKNRKFEENVFVSFESYLLESGLIGFLDLELSKPQRSSGRRRSRSPDRGTNRDGNRGRPLGGRDRGGRGRDDYRPGRSPSPSSYGRRGDTYRGSGDLDRGRFDARKRSRSRSPYGRSTRMRDRSPSPRRRDFDEDNSLLLRRAPEDVPEVQLIVLDDLDR
jgi:hypothetical protein